MQHHKVDGLTGIPRTSGLATGTLETNTPLETNAFMTKTLKQLGWWSAMLGISLSTILLAARASAQDQDQDQQDDPPTRVARLGYMEGSVSLQPAGETDWVQAVANRPMTTGDKLWADKDSRAELQLGSAVIRLNENTGFSFLNLDDNTVQIQLTSGSINLRVRRLDQNDDYEIDTPNLAFTVSQPGSYRVEASEDGTYSVVGIREGGGEATGNGQTYTLHAGQRGTFSGTDSLNAEVVDIGGPDQFDDWAYNRDQRYDESRSAQYLSHDVVGYEDLDDNGDWRDDSNYGHVWFPNAVAAGWAPYHQGHWDWIAPWGYTWIDDSPWGYAPFHYGRWVTVGGRWGWVAGPVAVRAVYAPALVVFIGGGGMGFGGNVAWFPLGPREVYVPPYQVSRGYMAQVNISNTTVNTTTITNVYNTTIINKSTTITNVTYANRNVQGAVMAVPQRAFASAQPVARAAVSVNAQQIASAPVSARVAVAPTPAECARVEGFDRESCERASGSSDEPAGDREADAPACAGAVCQTAAGSGGSSRTAVGEKRGAELASSGCCGIATDGQAGAPGQAGNADSWPSGQPAECCPTGTARFHAARQSAGQSPGQSAVPQSASGRGRSRTAESPTNSAAEHSPGGESSGDTVNERPAQSTRRDSSPDDSSDGAAGAHGATGAQRSPACGATE